MESVKEYIKEMLGDMDAGVVATPNEKYLEEFSAANNGSNDFLLMQMSKQYGFKLGLESVLEVIEELEKIK